MRKFLLHTSWMAAVLGVTGLVLVGVLWASISPIASAAAGGMANLQTRLSVNEFEAPEAGAVSRPDSDWSEAGYSTPRLGASCPCLAERPFWRTFLTLVPSNFLHRAVEKSCGCGFSCRGKDLI